MTILVVDDEPDIVELVRFHLEREGYDVVSTGEGRDALEKARNLLPDAIILDLMLPGMSGLEVCRLLRQQDRTSHIPILMLTAKSEETDVVVGLELGADDYITKPFSPRILLARLKAVLKRTRPPEGRSDEPIVVGELVIDPHRYSVRVRGREIILSATEFAILSFLARNPGWVFSRQQIIDAVKGEDYPVTERAVDVQILSIRKKLGDARDYIQTVRGVGYRLQPV
ncbi:response regulator [Spirochaeta thermophila]|uniref:Transcriptional regulatory protein n=1 Tax=Winmispira thermophila (strain ATCC 49972 / DSM 6192 / RI 19.B1) TaxID=665571 RepID=E0RQK2_WINT6|nr:response regulator transcription factor [Spirochaeta thermophila]ADN01506.1 transcriptional regulatory protein [Spirochaeta thermophila DSM 6192]